ncbi:hypothetical protein Tasa_007_043 [Tanticharoenia sakaeratensis NBRC 103193]|uniref:Uncharacterized protein n=1 Tax=Tanticharoenia sakaeratensis NBRC 103193 TaxID=1231623 RepID=A0A0D6MIU1_9PROT|nr:hypothetical protein Tasa_007_043 [Tanticharoenia sakaeratensis NBRC 103193]GBQ24006.1 hypothetical protein AA103193_2602 [Tanticharoenia sakaeratensis NBRC 103193]
MALPTAASAASAIQAYRTQTGQYSKTLLTTPVGSNNAPLVSTYKGSDGQWHPLVVTQQVCSLDANGAPQGCDNLTTSLIGQPSGIAGLDAHGNLTNNFTGSINGLEAAALVGGGAVLAPVSSPILTGAPLTSAGQQPLISLGRFPIGTSLSDSRISDPFQSPDALYIGGLPTQGWAATNGSANNDQARPGSLVVTGQPWGPFNAAAIESLLMSSSVDSQNGVCATDWRQGPGHICGADGVGQYIGVTNVEAMIVGNVASYTANSVVLKTPLTTAQMAQLRVGMYITTNTLNPTSVSATSTDYWGNEKVTQQNYYLSVISGWSSDGTTINVSGWDIPGASSHPTGQIPGSQTGDALDTWASNYGSQVVFIGNPNDGSARNEYLDYKGYHAGDDTTGATQTIGQATALAHALTGDEMDLRYWATRPNEVHLDGLTISIAGDSGTPLGRAALTPDSYGLAISGDVHNSLELDGPSDGNTILSHSFYLHGNEGVQTLGGVNRPVQTLFGFSGEVDGDSSYNLMGWLKKDNTTANGISGASFHLGIVDNGYANSLDPSQNGAGEIVWNQNGTNQGGLSLCGANACGIDVLPGGQVKLDQQMNSTAPIAMMAGEPIQFVPSDNNGYSYWYAPPSVGGLTLSAKTYQGGDAYITAYMYQEGLYTPSSSSSTCTTGQFTDDSNYHYVCVATNTWKRVALSSF